jgi:hypothetical protein
MVMNTRRGWQVGDTPAAAVTASPIGDCYRRSVAHTYSNSMRVASDWNAQAIVLAKHHDELRLQTTVELSLER